MVCRAWEPQPCGARRRAGICGVAAPRRYHHIACVAAPCICLPGARAKMPTYSCANLRGRTLYLLHDRPLVVQLEYRAHLSFVEPFQLAPQFFPQVTYLCFEVSTLRSGGVYGMGQGELFEIPALLDSLEQVIGFALRS